MNSFDRFVMVMLGTVAVLIAGVILLGDHVGIPVNEVYPLDGSRPPVTTDVRVTFASAMDQTEAQTHFSINPAIPGTFRWEDRTLIFTPSAAFHEGVTYTVQVTEGAISSTGRHTVGNKTWSFTPRSQRTLYLAPTDEAIRALWVSNMDGSTPRQLFGIETGVRDFAVSRDGSQIAISIFHEDLTADIWLTDAEGQHTRPITDCRPGSCSGPAWSPDGTLIAYQHQDAATSGTPGASRIWLYNVQTQETAPVFEDNQVLGYTPTWSADGRLLAFFDGNAQVVHVVEISTGKDIQLHNQMGDVGTLAPDGHAVVYTDIRPVGEGYFSQLMLARIQDASSPVPLIGDAQEDQFAAWSPDGQWIAFSRRSLNRENGLGSQLALFNIATGQVQVPPQEMAYSSSSFTWDASGTRIMVERFKLVVPQSTQELWIYDLTTGSFNLLATSASQGQWLP